MPFFIAAGAIVVGIGILSTAHGLFSEAERVQAEPVARPAPAGTTPVLLPVGNTVAPDHAAGVILAAIDNSPMAALVTGTAARLASADGRAVHVVHAQEDVTASDTATDGEDLEDARTLVRNQLDLLAAHHVQAQGQVLRHAPVMAWPGGSVAEYATQRRAGTIVIGAPTHGGLSALMDDSASQELWRHARSNILVVDPDAPGTLAASEEWSELASLRLGAGLLAAPAARPQPAGPRRGGPARVARRSGRPPARGAGLPRVRTGWRLAPRRRADRPPCPRG